MIPDNPAPPPLANAVSALYPKDSEEKHSLDAMLLAVNTLLPLPDTEAGEGGAGDPNARGRDTNTKEGARNAKKYRVEQEPRSKSKSAAKDSRNDWRSYDGTRRGSGHGGRGF